MPHCADTPGAGDPDCEALPIETATALAALAPPQPAWLGPVAPGTITLLRGPRGVGKSWLALAMARAIASGGELLGWKARQAPVLYVEAAMAAAALGQRLRILGLAPEALSIARRFPCTASANDDNLRQALGPSKVLVLDGLSLLVNRGTGRLGQRWRALSDDLSALREAGCAIVLVEHARRALIEDLADTILVLKPQMSDADVAFAVETTSRQALARQDRRFGVDLSLQNTAAWCRRETIDPALAAVAAQAHRSDTVRAGAAALGLSTATYWRRLQSAKTEGLVSDRVTCSPKTGPGEMKHRGLT